MRLNRKFFIHVLSVFIYAGLFYPGIVFAAGASISLSGTSSWSAGTRGALSEMTTGSQWTVFNNNSEGTEDVQIRVVSTGSWTASTDGGSSTNKFVLRKNTNAGALITGTNSYLVTGLVNNGSHNFGLYFKTPPSGSENGAHTLTVTLTAVNWVWACGNNITFTYRGGSVTYGTIARGSKCWMDRNLGASQKASAYNDSSAYGDYFQWGRLSDGHQDANSIAIIDNSASDVPGHSNFIVEPSSPFDWRIPSNNSLWASGINNPCPSGWHVPSSSEWATEKASWSQQNYNGAFSSLKLTVAGVRYYTDATFKFVNAVGYYWTENIGYRISFSNSSVDVLTSVRANGFPVRCIKY
ncbi:MAG: hypothetical protein ABIH71_06350 [Candidatus Omnitrophota bacterium]|nr:fibrobacter succinogenes major paralogous domain-containing protein [Candidatus Omnitrophota bacterium]